MIPRTSSGRGFKGAAAYYLHDKGAETSERVRFTHTLNLSNDNPDRAINEMAWTAMHQAELKAQAGEKATGRKLEKPVYTFSLSWHPTETPTDAQMIEAGMSALHALKMDDHQVLMVAHRDTGHPHVHLIVNRVNPENGIAHPLKKDQLILSKWAEKYERDHGKTWCIERVKNNAERRERQEKERGKFVKDKADQQRDARPEYDRRAKAMEAKRLASAAQKSARDAWERKAHQDAIDEAARQDAGEIARELYRAAEIEPPYEPKLAEAQFQEQLRQDRKREAFEQWQIAQINAMQDRHNEERDGHARKYEAILAEAAKRIEEQYGPSRRADEKRLAWLIERQQKGSFLSRVVDRVRGYAEERECIEKNLAYIAHHSQQILSPIVKQEVRARSLLHDRQEQQKRDQAALFERQAQAGYEIPRETPRVEISCVPWRNSDRDIGRGRGMG